MNPVTLVVILSALPAVLMASAHFYALATQDRSARFVVLLRSGVPLNGTINEHVRRHRVVVERTFPAVNGYSARVPLRRVQRLEDDRRVLRLERREADEPAGASPQPVRRTA